MKIKYLLTICFLSAGLMVYGQQIKKSTKGEFLLQNATLITVTNGDIEADLLIKDGKIAQIGKSINSSSAELIDCTGKFIYPGFIDAGTTLGLQEIGSVSLTSDHGEVGDFIPHMDALTAVNPNAVAIPVTRVNGITNAITKPTGGMFPGKASLIHLHGYTPKQMYAGYEAVIMNYPSSGRRGRWDRRTDEEVKKAEEKAAKKLNDIWKQIEIYAKIDSAALSQNKAVEDYQPEMQAVVGVARGKAPIMIEVNKKSDIESALKWIESKNLNAILTGVSEGWRVADKIAEAGIPVITGPVMSMPGRSSDRYDSAYTNAGKMAKAGVKVALRTNKYENVRNLPYEAGFAATYGMGTVEALKALTINPAQMFGVADQLGSLEEGKLANLFVADGDPFETRTDIYHLFINGWNIPLESRHTLLYDEFLQRDPGVSND